LWRPEWRPCVVSTVFPAFVSACPIADFCNIWIIFSFTLSTFQMAFIAIILPIRATNLFASCSFGTLNLTAYWTVVVSTVFPPWTYYACAFFSACPIADFCNIWIIFSFTLSTFQMAFIAIILPIRATNLFASCSFGTLNLKAYWTVFWGFDGVVSTVFPPWTYYACAFF